MSSVRDVLGTLAAWWFEGLVRIGAHLTEVYGGPVASAETTDTRDADRAAWEEERARLALSPWWL